MKSVRNYFLHLLLRHQGQRWDPILSVYYLTFECQFRCPYCSDGAGKPYYRLRSPVLPAERVLAILREIRRHCSYLVITGGEPVQHPEFEQVLQGLPKLKFRGVILTTNGYGLAPFLPAAAGAVTDLVFSLQTMDPERGDRWYGYGKGTHRKILDTIEQAAAVPGRRYRIIISSVVTPENIHDLYGVYEYAQARGFRLAACPQLVGVKAHAELAEHPEYRKFYDFLIREKRRGAKIQGTVDYLEYMRDLRKFNCRPFTMLVVAPTGEVFYPCLELGNFAGNLLEEPDLHRLRQKGQAQFGPQPQCDTRCHSACALGFSRLLAQPWSALHEAGLMVKAGLRNFG